MRTTRVTINEHVIDIPAGVTARIDPPCAGGFDCLVYRGADVYTSERPRLPAAGLYLGPFVIVDDAGNLTECDTLADALRAIDAAEDDARLGRLHADGLI